jgi:predicted nucleic acid-binding protein
MRVLFDTNIVLDVLLSRSPWAEAADSLWHANDVGALSGYVVASALTDIYYIARKIKGRETAREAIRICLEAFNICAVDREVLELAHTSSGDDFEDNVLIACAQIYGIDVIATRDMSGFSSAPIPAQLPQDILSSLSKPD